MTGLLTSCYEVDFTGFFMRSEKANQRFTESMEWNVLNPYKEIVTDSDEYLILVMGDSHVGGTNNLTVDALKDGPSNAGYLKLFVTEEGVDYEFESLNSVLLIDP